MVGWIIALFCNMTLHHDQRNSNATSDRSKGPAQAKWFNLWSFRSSFCELPYCKAWSTFQRNCCTKWERTLLTSPPPPKPWGRRDRVLCSGGGHLALPQQQPPWRDCCQHCCKDCCQHCQLNHCIFVVFLPQQQPTWRDYLHKSRKISLLLFNADVSNQRI